MQCIRMLDTITIRVAPSTVARIERLRDRLASDPSTAALAHEVKRSAILRAALEHGLDGLEGPGSASAPVVSSGRGGRGR